jgi:hypothetical protein
MMTPRERARTEGFDFFCHTLFCLALRAKGEHEKRGMTCTLLPESMGRCTVYFLGVKPTVAKPTRAERGL